VTTTTSLGTMNLQALKPAKGQGQDRKPPIDESRKGLKKTSRMAPSKISVRHRNSKKIWVTTLSPPASTRSISLSFCRPTSDPALLAPRLVGIAYYL